MQQAISEVVTVRSNPLIVWCTSALSHLFMQPHTDTHCHN